MIFVHSTYLGFLLSKTSSLESVHVSFLLSKSSLPTLASLHVRSMTSGARVPDLSLSPSDKSHCESQSLETSTTSASFSISANQGTAFRLLANSDDQRKRRVSYQQQQASKDKTWHQWNVAPNWIPGSRVSGPRSLGPRSPGPLNIASPLFGLSATRMG